MIILENTDRWMIALFREGKSISVMDKPSENVYNFDGEEHERFMIAIDYIYKTRKNPASIHYMKTLDESIEYLVDQFTKKGH